MLEPETRAEFIKSQCKGNEGLQQAILDRLEQEIPEDPDATLVGSAGRQPPKAQSKQLLGQRIGYLTFEKLLGSGGMGDVYVAFDERLERRVAVKAIRASYRLDAEIRARFAREAKILSQLEHPNICRVYDYMTAAEADFLVLEWIHGVTLTDAIKKGLSKTRKLEIARQISDGLQTAHSKLIVHRDLKPGNVMITDRGGVKILDFGLARPVGEPVSQKTDSDPTLSSPSSAFVTTVGQVMGTPMFMSPEQAHCRTVTAASDMYSFGLLLQWLFTESNPYEEGLSSFELIVKAGKAETAPLTGLDTDLTSLINRLKSLDPAIRPSSEEASKSLVEILELPRRRKRRIVTVAFIVLLVLGLLGTTLGLIQAKRAQAKAVLALEKAESEADKAKEIISVLQEFMSSPDPLKRGIDVKVTDLIYAFKPTLNGLSDHPEVRATILHTFGNTLDALGDSEEAMTMLEEAAEIRLSIYGDDHPDALESQHQLALTLYHVGFMIDAELLWRKVFEKRKALLGEDHPDTLNSLFYLAAALDFLGRYQDAEPLFREALERRRAVLGDRHPDTLTTLSRFSANRRHLELSAEAEAMERECWEIRRDVLGDDHPDTLMSMSNLSKILWDLQQDVEAESLSRKVIEGRRNVLGPLHPYTRYGLHDLRRALRSRGREAEAAEVSHEIFQIRSQSGADMELAEAVEAGAESALYLVETRLREGNNEEMTAQDISRIANQFLRENKPEKAVTTLEMSVTYFPDSFWTYANLGDLYDEQDNFDKARHYYLKALEIAPRNLYLKRRLAAVEARAPVSQPVSP